MARDFSKRSMSPKKMLNYCQCLYAFKAFKGKKNKGYEIVQVRYPYNFYDGKFRAGAAHKIVR